MVAMVRVTLPIVVLLIGRLLRHQDVVLLRGVLLPVGNILAFSLSILQAQKQKNKKLLLPKF